MKLWDHMKLLLTIRVLALAGDVLYWRPQIASAKSAASDVQNRWIEDAAYIEDSGDNQSVVFNAKKSSRRISKTLERSRKRTENA